MAAAAGYNPKTHKFKLYFHSPQFFTYFTRTSGENSALLCSQESRGIPVEPGSRCAKVLESLSAIVQIIGDRVPGTEIFGEAVGSLRACDRRRPAVFFGVERSPATHIEAEVSLIGLDAPAVPGTPGAARYNLKRQ